MDTYTLGTLWVGIRMTMISSWVPMIGFVVVRFVVTDTAID